MAVNVAGLDDRDRDSPRSQFHPQSVADRLQGKLRGAVTTLERQRADLLEEVGDVLTQHKTPEALPDVSDQASAEEDQRFSMRIMEREQKLLKKVNEALGRMKNQTYGICEQCGEDIPYKRLKARPVTTFCIECKTLQEQKERARR